MAEPRSHHSILLHSVLIPMCRLIPVPFLDDLVQDQLERRHVSAIAQAHGRTLTAREANALCGHEAGGCSCWGCLVYLPLLPFKKALRKLLYFLEWKSALDLAARTYVEGYALDHLFAEGLWPAGEQEPARRVHEGLDRVVTRLGTSPIEAAFQTVWTGARQAVLTTSGLLSQKLRRLAGLEREAQRVAVTRVLDELESEEGERLEALLARLSQALAQVHGDYFERLRQFTAEEFQNETSACQTPPPPA